MTITVTDIDQGPFVATGAAQTVPYTFMTLTDGEIEVFYDAGPGRVLIDPAFHTVTPNKNVDGSAKEGGSVELAVGAAPAGSGIYLRAAPRGDRDVVWNDVGSRLRNLNDENDRAALRSLVQGEVSSRAVVVAPGAPAVDPQDVIDAAALIGTRANLFLSNVEDEVVREKALSDASLVQDVALADTDRVQDIALSALQISPENFYQTADAGDWAPAFERMETFRRALSNAGRQTPIRLRKGDYPVKAPINMKVGVNDSLFMFGAGHMLDGSRISPVAGWTGGTTPVLTIEGDAGANTNAQFMLQGFAIVQPEGSGVAESGLMVKNINGPSGASFADDIYIEGFKYPLTTTNARLIEWNRICIWSRNIANAEPIRVTSDGVGAFGGDMTFNQCQTVAGVPGTYTSPNGSVGVHISAANGGVTRGIRFNGYIGYHADIAVKIRATANATAGGIVGDIWFNAGCQFDQTVVKPWDIQTTQSGANHGTIFSVNFIGCYWSTILGSHDTAVISGTRANAPNQINANSGLVSELHIVDCMIPNFSKNLFFKNVVGLHFINNDLYGYGNPAVSLDTIVVLEDCYNVKMRGNVARATAPNISYAVIVSGGGSIEIDGWAGSVTAVRDWGEVVRKEMWGRPVLRGPIPAYADNAAAAAAGVLVDEVYRTAAGVLMVRY